MGAAVSTNCVTAAYLAVFVIDGAEHVDMVRSQDARLLHEDWHASLKASRP